NLKSKVMKSTILLIGTLDTKGREIAYVRDKIRELGAEALVLDSGILGEPIDIVPDISRAEVATSAGSTIDDLRGAGTRGAAAAVVGMAAQRADDGPWTMDGRSEPANTGDETQPTLRTAETRKYVAITMLGNTTKAVMRIKERLAERGLEAVIFHSNGVGGP